MLVTEIVSIRKIEPLKTKVICQLAWDDQLKKIVILKGKRVGRRILRQRYLDKRWPEKEQYLSADQGKDFIKNLCYGICGSRVWATLPYKKESE